MKSEEGRMRKLNLLGHPRMHIILHSSLLQEGLHFSQWFHL